MFGSLTNFCCFNIHVLFRAGGEGTGTMLLTRIAIEVLPCLKDKEAKNHTLSSGTSPYRPRRGQTAPRGVGCY